MSKNSLFYSQAEYLNFALHKNQIDVYEIIEPNNDKEYLYALVKEINRTQLEKLDKCGFQFFCIEPFILMDGHHALWIQFRNSFD